MRRQMAFVFTCVAWSMMGGWAQVRANPLDVGVLQHLNESLLQENPFALHLVDAQVTQGVLHVTIQGDYARLRHQDQLREDLVHRLWRAATLDHPEIRGIQVWCQDSLNHRELLSRIILDPQEADWVSRLDPDSASPFRGLPPQDLPFGGSLSGKTLVVSPGHGWIYSDAISNWSFQRRNFNWPGCPTCPGITEDLFNNELVYRYLIPDLLRAGATVWSVRERDPSSFEQILDEHDPSVSREGTWIERLSPEGHQGDHWELLTGGGGRMSFPLNPPQEGTYWVSMWMVSAADHVTDALVRVSCQEGIFDQHIDQSENGSRWIHLGMYRLSPGTNARLEFMPGPDAQPDRYLVADAVRLGGGFDATVVSGKPANQPRWMMSALYYLSTLGFESAPDIGNDITVRPLFAEWQGADAYVSVHGNATGTVDNYSGTSVYRFNCLTLPDHSPAPDPSVCDEPPGSDSLQRAIHGSVLQTLRQSWDPAWRDQGRLVANFGEVRPLQNIPGALIETAFFDGTRPASGSLMSDNQAMQDPRWRRLVAYGIYAGVSKHFNPAAILAPPDPPTGLHLVQESDAGLTLNWDPVEMADGYRVVRWSDPPGFADEEITTERSLILTGQTPGEVVWAQVSALNAGGEGPASELAAARYRGHGTPADLLLVSGFDREDAFLGDGANSRQQAKIYSRALADLGSNVYFDFASNESVSAGNVTLPSYRAVVWILGEESTQTETFSNTEQGLITSFLNNGGSLMASGSEIGWDLAENGSAGDSQFFSTSFCASYISNDAQTLRALGSGIFSALGEVVFGAGQDGSCRVQAPDVVGASPSDLVLTYQTGGAAAVACLHSPGRTLLMGFPFEAIDQESQRVQLLQLALSFLMPDLTPDDYDGDGLPDDWEYDHQTDPQRPSAHEDPDHDCKDNLQEYLDGTDPQVPDPLPDSECEGGASGDGGPDENPSTDGADAGEQTQIDDPPYGSDGSEDGGSDLGADQNSEASNSETVDIPTAGCGCGALDGDQNPGIFGLSCLMLLLAIRCKRWRP